MPPRARGNYTIKKLTARRRVNADTQSYEIPYVGPYTALAAAEPLVGSTVLGYPAAFKVDQVTLEETGGGSGRMVVVITKPQPGTPTGSDDTQLAEPIYESDYCEERRPIEEHKKCGKLKDDRPYYEYPAMATSLENKAINWSPSPTNSGQYRQRTWEHWVSLNANDYSESGGGWSLAVYKSLRESGFDSFPVALPICSVTSYHRFRPVSTGGINAVSAPPSQCSPPTGFIYVKTGDRVTKQGRLYTRVQSWKGFHPGMKSEFFL